MLFVAAFTFTDCSKKSSNPTPTTNNNTTQSPNTFTISGGSAEALTVSAPSGSGYVIKGTGTTGTYTGLLVNCPSKPTSSGTFSLGGSTITAIAIADNTSGPNYWIASSGYVTITISGTSVTFTFTNLTFVGSSPASLTASGSITGN